MKVKNPTKFIRIHLKSIGFVLFLLIFQGMLAQQQTDFISSTEKASYFPLFAQGKISQLYIDAEDFQGVVKTAEIFKQDLERITDHKPELVKNQSIAIDFPVIIGTIGKNKMIDQLIDSGKLPLGDLKGSWERYSIQVVKNPFPEVSQALVIAGSDKRGTIYGMYEFSKQAGVSPWYWWADVPVKKSKSLYVNPEPFTQESPKVKYRGIFINDEAPALSGWVSENFGDFNHEFYEHVFELVLRLKGNFLWPAMWGRAFYDDDPKNAELADLYGVVIGTSHHEPLMRAHAEWDRYGKGAWNYNTNAENLQEFWRNGIKRMGDNESVVTVGMRGDGDEPMSEGTAIELLETIVKDQRDIIAEVTEKPAEETPQVWALYKEVQDYYDQGMRVPDDVTLLLADDNWGNIRKLPDPNEPERTGGYGIYYHFDYVGGPRNYKWINSTQISRVWEQMNLAYTYGADQLWIVNVGDIKPMEFPTSFFLDMAWNPEEMDLFAMENYTENWAKEQFGNEFSVEIADLLLKYTQYSSRRKPELLSPETYSLVNNDEAHRVLKEWEDLETRAIKIGEKLGDASQDAYYQLVLFPIQALSNLTALYIAAAKNHLYAGQGRVIANEYADEVVRLFKKDSLLTETFHNDLSDGKWNHMMAQTHIGYTYWQQPDQNNMPKVQYIESKKEASMGISLEGSKSSWSDENDEAELVLRPTADSTYVEIFNKGTESFEYKIVNEHEWLLVGQNEGMVKDQQRVYLGINPAKWNESLSGGEVIVEGAGSEISLNISVEKSNYVVLNSIDFEENLKINEEGWTVIPNLGRTGSAISPLAESPKQWEKENRPQVSYSFNYEATGEVKISFQLSPSLDFRNQDGLRFAWAIDDQEPVILNLQKDTEDSWDESVANNVTTIHTTAVIEEKGEHKIHLYAIDQGIVIQKIIISKEDLKNSYLGPVADKFD